MAGFGGLGATFSRLGTSGLGAGISPPYPAPDGYRWDQLVLRDADNIDQAVLVKDADGVDQPVFLLLLN